MNVLFCLLCAFSIVSGKYYSDRGCNCPSDTPCLQTINGLDAGHICAECGDFINPPPKVGPNEKPVNCSKLQCAKAGYQCIDRLYYSKGSPTCCYCPYVETANYQDDFLSHPSEELCKETCQDDDGVCRQTETGCWVCIYSLWHMWSFWLFVVLLPPILFGLVIMAPFLVIACSKHKQRKRMQQNQH